MQAWRILFLSGVDLYYSNLNHTNLKHSDLTNAFIGETTFGDNDFTRVKGLDKVRYGAPCTIGVDTIYNQKIVFQILF